MSCRRTPLVGLVAALLTPIALADFESGLAAHRAGDLGVAHDRWRECALAGEARCQFGLGVLLDDGIGVERDSYKALAWYQAAAAQDHPEAMMQLGFLYATGRVQVVQDPVRAWAWFSRAAALGVPEAARNRDRVSELLTEDELLRAQRLADQLSIRYHLQEQ